MQVNNWPKPTVSNPDFLNEEMATFNAEQRVNKILAGLEDALEHAKHDRGAMVVQSIDELSDGRQRVTSRCEHCGARETTFYPAGTFEIIKVN